MALTRCELVGEFDVDAHIRRVRENPFYVVYDRLTGSHVAATVPGGFDSERASSDEAPDQAARPENDLVSWSAVIGQLDAMIDGAHTFRTRRMAAPFKLSRNQALYRVHRRTGTTSTMERSDVEDLAQCILDIEAIDELIDDSTNRYVVAALAEAWDELATGEARMESPIVSTELREDWPEIIADIHRLEQLYGLAQDGHGFRFGPACPGCFHASEQFLQGAYVKTRQPRICTICGHRLRRREYSPVVRGTLSKLLLPPMEAPSGDANDRRLFEFLRERRLAWAREEAVPAYVVCNNETLHDIARRRPTTPEDLLQVRGIGHARLKKYGDQLLDAVATFQRDLERQELRPGNR